MRQSAVFVALSALGLAAAQSNFTVDPNTIDPTTRTEWCNAEFNTCGILCGGVTKANSCTPSDLKFVCTCTNGTAPGLEYYIQSMPTLLCEQAFKDCIAKNTGNSQEQGKCTSEIKSKCGTLDPAKAEIGGGDSSASSTGASPSRTPASTTAGEAAASTTAGAMPTAIGNGFAAVAVGVLAAALL
ncbi:hypothetical protein QBC34DRAFT_434619 [Podospora aff. communis PSN243]|uniref:DUF7707 domain-containing protein n=1 Tax=Podospora aff. communis PSN243 TaxID=3040156 RepID=A0AAV9GWH4_9PEZI|nr:hypothetical protein QBC34DRAFT_434619 [Podospora aff. communis PSN243]